MVLLQFQQIGNTSHNFTFLAILALICYGIGTLASKLVSKDKPDVKSTVKIAVAVILFILLLASAEAGGLLR